MWYRIFAAQKRAGEIQLYERFEILYGGFVDSHGWRMPAGVVDYPVEGPEMLHSLCYSGLQRPRIAHIDGKRQHIFVEGEAGGKDFCFRYIGIAGDQSNSCAVPQAHKRAT